MSLKSRIRQSMWLEWVNQSLYFRVPWRRRRQIIQELKANLAVASAEVGPDDALAQFGPAKELVSSYLDSDRGRFDLAIAITAGLGMWVAWLFFAAAVWVVAWDTRDAISTTSELTHTYFGVVHVHITGDGRGRGSAEFGMDNPVVSLTCLAAFLIGGRVWRLFQRRPKLAA